MNEEQDTRIEDLEAVVDELLERVDMLEIEVYPHCSECDEHHPVYDEDDDLLEMAGEQDVN